MLECLSLISKKKRCEKMPSLNENRDSCYQALAAHSSTRTFIGQSRITITQIPLHPIHKHSPESLRGERLGISLRRRLAASIETKT
ncbi:hypothetical protein CEXT_595371 [Caerostris extrusa]|uniref:Uncharacterized protein n=1 Tax=Caerostris extrusa TaxID=172846 RepID=A0AAV4RRN5_CAEEX|nr:hypothetical protein CEXT_595371 [Caerostris extrusa]